MERVCASLTPSLTLVNLVLNYVVGSGKNNYKLIEKGSVGAIERRTLLSQAKQFFEVDSKGYLSFHAADGEFVHVEVGKRCSRQIFCDEAGDEEALSLLNVNIKVRLNKFRCLPGGCSRSETKELTSRR